jgi:hypothetical protein
MAELDLLASDEVLTAALRSSPAEHVDAFLASSRVTSEPALRAVLLRHDVGLFSSQLLEGGLVTASLVNSLLDAGAKLEPEVVTMAPLDGGLFKRLLGTKGPVRLTALAMNSGCTSEHLLDLVPALRTASALEVSSAVRHASAHGSATPEVIEALLELDHVSTANGLAQRLSRTGVESWWLVPLSSALAGAPALHVGAVISRHPSFEAALTPAVHPGFLRHYHRSLFDAVLERAGADLETADDLIASWEGSLEDLAAASRELGPSSARPPSRRGS